MTPHLVNCNKLSARRCSSQFLVVMMAYLILLLLLGSFYTRSTTATATTATTFISTSKLKASYMNMIRCASVRNETSDSPCTTSSTSSIINESIAWPSTSNPNHHHETTREQERKETEQELYQYLYNNLMPFDIPNAESLGFHMSPNDTNNSSLPDGLSSGIVGPTITLALDAKRDYAWTNHVPKEIYFEYVASFGNVNEARNNWRPLFHDALLQSVIQPLISMENNATVEQVIRAVNQNLWDQFYTKETIYFKSGQTPLIYDPMSIIAYGYASCTGVSIFLIDALRTVGIPARLAGTAAWNGKEENGNHSWIEFYGSDSQWHIMESKPASGGSGDEDDLWDPCQWWFCNGDKVEGTSFYAARLDRVGSDGVVFPLAWDLDNDGVVGEDRTDFMRELCSRC